MSSGDQVQGDMDKLVGLLPALIQAFTSVVSKTIQDMDELGAKV